MLVGVASGGAMVSATEGDASDEAEYHVVVWRENEDESGDAEVAGESIVAVLTKTAKVGETVEINENNYFNFFDSKTFEHYYQYEFSAGDSGVVEADGSTVLNVHFIRRTFALRFHLRMSWDDDDMTERYVMIGGEKCTENEECGFSAKIGQNIAGMFPETVEGLGISGDFCGWTTSKNGSGVVKTATTRRLNLTEDLIPGGEVTDYYAYVKRGAGYEVHYFLENAEDEDYTESEELAQSVKAYTNDGVETKTILGFSADKDRSGCEKKVCNLYYKRNVYTLHFLNKFDEVKSVEVKFGAGIEGEDFTPEVLLRGEPEREFAGWFTEPGLENEFGFSGAEMPRRDLFLFVKFAEKPEEVMPPTPSEDEPEPTVEYEPVVATFDVFKDFGGFWTPADSFVFELSESTGGRIVPVLDENGQQMTAIVSATNRKATFSVTVSEVKYYHYVVTERDNDNGFGGTWREGVAKVTTPNASMAAVVVVAEDDGNGKLVTHVYYSEKAGSTIYNTFNEPGRGDVDDEPEEPNEPVVQPEEPVAEAETPEVKAPETGARRSQFVAEATASFVGAGLLAVVLVVGAGLVRYNYKLNERKK